MNAKAEPRAATAPRAGARAAARVAEATVVLPPRFDFRWAVRFLSARLVPAIERFEHDTYHRALRLGGAPVALAIRSGDAALTVRSSPALPAGVLADVVGRMFDLDAEVDGFVELAERDRLLAPLVARQPYIRLPQLVDPFEGLVRAILGQQVSVAAASTMADRVVRLAGDEAPTLDGAPLRCFPSAAALARVPDDELRAIGLTRAKAASLSAAARAAAEGTLDLPRLRGRDATEVDAALMSVRGVGAWTAAYVRMRALGDRDAFPSTDLGVMKAMRALARIDSDRRIERRAARWRPWRAYAALHLWESLSTSERGA